MFKDEQIAITTAGAFKDSATVAATTFAGGLFAGPIGAVLGQFFFKLFKPLSRFYFFHLGAATGTGILGASKLLGYGQYKSLCDVLNEDLSEKERQALYERLWVKLQTALMNQNLVLSALDKLTKAIQQNPEIIESIRNELSKWLSERNMSFK